jgi:hypothetical protein
MRMPILAAPVERGVSMMKITGGIEPSFCTPCVFGQQICCDFSWTPPFIHCHTQSCPDGDGVCTPCVLGHKICTAPPYIRTC